MARKQNYLTLGAGPTPGWQNQAVPGTKMTVQQYFSSNAPGGFYEGFEQDEATGNWVPVTAADTTSAQLQHNDRCARCGEPNKGCICL